jgi:small-conductance mechanosensitive channel
MDELTLQRLLYSALFILLNYLVFHILKRAARKTQVEFHIRQSRFLAVRRLLTFSSYVVALGGLILIWGLNVKNIWISVSSALALVAITFFAMWSLIGNILAGLLIYFTSPFKIEDEVEVMPDEIKGQVMAINTFYTILQDEHGDYINVPNSMFFQKYIRVKSTKFRENKIKEDSGAIEEPE